MKDQERLMRLEKAVVYLLEQQKQDYLEYLHSDIDGLTEKTIEDRYYEVEKILRDMQD